MKIFKIILALSFVILTLQGEITRVEKRAKSTTTTQTKVKSQGQRTEMARIFDVSITVDDSAKKTDATIDASSIKTPKDAKLLGLFSWTRL